MEKRVPTYNLESIKDAIREGRWSMTFTARRDIFGIGGDDSEAEKIVLSLERKDFYKSMTSNGNHKIWQDVYHPEWRKKKLYFKITIDEEGYLLLSLKPK